MTTFNILHSTSFGMGLEIRKAKSIDSLLEKLPKRIITIFDIWTEDDQDLITPEISDLLEKRRDNLINNKAKNL